MYPFLTFVIANYNYGKMLSSAIESILNQNDKDFEIIIVDGGSTDCSLEVIKKYEDQISWWVSEKDNGQSNAFNKGFAKAKGEFITWLNADDILLPGTISAVKKKLKKNKWADWATGNFVRFQEPKMNITNAPWGPNWVPLFLQNTKCTNAIFGPTTFWKRSVYEKVGKIDEKLHYMMDVDYWIRLTMAGHKYVRINHYCWGFRMHSDSKTAEFETHKHSIEIKNKMQEERTYIYKKTGYKPSKFYRYLALGFRLLDGSIFMAIWNMKNLVGKNINKCFGIDYL